MPLLYELTGMAMAALYSNHELNKTHARHTTEDVPNLAQESTGFPGTGKTEWRRS